MTDLRLWLWPVDRPSRQRTKELKVLAVGLSRTGTDSLRAALAILGYENVYHGFAVMHDVGEACAWDQLMRRKQRGDTLTADDFDRILGESEAVADLPAAAFAPELIRAYPEALVVVNHRNDIDAWCRSVIKAIASAEYRITDFLCLFDTRLFWLHMMGGSCVKQGIFKGDLWNPRPAYEAHYAAIDECLPGERRLKWCTNDGWEPLCEFLGRPHPDMVPFPRLNASAEFDIRFKKIMVPIVVASFTKMFLSLAVTGVLVAIVIQRY